MDKAHLAKMIAQGESISVEFKKSRTHLNKNVFESVCAFMNRNGGHLFLGVEDNGNIAGIEESAVASVFNNFVTSVNNPQKLFLTFLKRICRPEKRATPWRPFFFSAGTKPF
jgi:ATP-dependent DNA helicase RecG